METASILKFPGGLRASDDAIIEESGLLGTRRGWKNINRYEIIFLVLGILAAIATDSLTIIRLVRLESIRDPDFAYGILILVNSVFLLLFLMTGIFYQRITDIVAFLISAVMLTVYVIAHYVARRKETDQQSLDETIRRIRLIFTIVFNVCFIPLAILVIRDYQRDEFSKRLFGAFPVARRPLKIYNTFDCLARISTMLSISTYFLNLYNFNDYELTDEIFLAIGIPFTFLWLGTGIGMVRLENRLLFAVFCLVSLLQPGFLGYSLYNAIKDSPMVTSTTMRSTMTTTMTTATSSVSSTETTTSSFFTTVTTTAPRTFVSVPDALYVCVGTNILTHILSIVFAFLCFRNFGKGLKERVFNNRFDKWFRRCFRRP